MKVYVDELPKSCEECPCCNECMDYGISCNLDDIKLSYYDYAEKRHKDCPLQSLTDHDKQVRKEVCEEIGKNVDVDIINFKVYVRYDNLTKILDKIQEDR